ncbi:MAG: GNAT family N-acetyltransferase [Vicinamibacterales bacterium]
MSLQLATAAGAVPVSALAAAHAAVPPGVVTLRSARAADAAAIHALVESHLDEGHLLPRTRQDVETQATRFVVATDGTRILACAELAPLSTRVAEVRSLVVHADARHAGVGRQLVDELARRARVQGFDTLCAFTHGAGYFVGLGFSLVPHHWLGEKIVADCQGCALFRRCGQSAVAVSLTDTGRAGRLPRTRGVE